MNYSTLRETNVKLNIYINMELTWILVLFNKLNNLITETSASVRKPFCLMDLISWGAELTNDRRLFSTEHDVFINMQHVLELPI